MDIERLNRHITQENLALRLENSQLKKQMAAKDNMLTRKDGEILQELNKYANNVTGECGTLQPRLRLFAHSELQAL